MRVQSRDQVHDTCVPVPPHLEDNTQCPYIIIMENPYTNDQGTKDNVWESDQDRVGVSVQICADDPATVRTLSPASELPEIPVVTPEQSGLLCFHSR